LLTTWSAPAYAQEGCSLVQVSLTPDYQIVPSYQDVCGLRLNLLSGSNQGMTGLDLGLLGSAVESKGIQLNLIGNMTSFSDSRDGSGTRGIQIGGLVNIQFATEMQGIQLASLLNWGDAEGIQIASMNAAGDARGIQIGIFNHSEKMKGLQIGIVNMTREMKGVQIGIINTIGEGAVPFLPLINVGF
jgi:hypothetical protein